MTASHFSGPLVSAGAPASGSSTGKNPEAGPSISYQGAAVLDPTYPYAPGVSGAGKIRALYPLNYFTVVDAKPAAFGAAGVAAAQTITASTAMTLATAASTGFSIKAVMQEFGTATSYTSLVGFDLGFTTATTTASSKSVTVGSSSQLFVGQPITILGAGTSGKPHFTTVATIVSTTAITIVDAAVTAVTTQPLATANDSLTSLDPYVPAGAARLFDPTQAVSRAVSVTASATSSATGSIKVVGLDVFGDPMSETINCTGGAATVFYGKKAFKYVQSATPAFTTTSFTYSVGNSDVFGFAVRDDLWEYADVNWAGVFLSASTGWTAADTTSPATAATGDTRGTMQISQYGTSTTYPAGGAANGTLRIVASIGTPMRLATITTPDNLVPSFGVAQV